MNNDEDIRRQHTGRPGGNESGGQSDRFLSSRDRYNAKHGKRDIMDEEQKGHLRNKEKDLGNARSEPNKGS